MIELQYIRNQPDEVTARLERRNFKNAAQIVEQIAQADADRRQTQTRLDDLLAQSNQMARSIGKLMKEGKKEEGNAARQQASKLKEEAKALEEQMKEASEKLTDLLLTVPNLPHESVPVGVSADDNEVMAENGTVPELPEAAQPHWELIKKYDIIDFDLGNKITGAGFPVYKGKGARLQRALVQFFLDEADQAGYIEVQPPIVINRASGLGTGQLPDKDGQMYHITNEDFFLIPTAEVPITNMYRDVMLSPEQLPIKHAGYTPCFRREAGSWGADVRGLNRLHQFDKVEIVQITEPDKSYKALDEMRQHVEQLLQKLELPYRVLRLCGGDLGFTSAITFDMEVYSAAQKRWLEVSSVSNFETYQSNRLMLRCKSKDKKTYLLHTLNGSALALPRILAAILENNQQTDKITIPAVLHKYTGFQEIS